MLSTNKADGSILASQFVLRSSHVRLGIDIPDRWLDRRRTRAERHRRRGNQYRLDPFRHRADTGADILRFRSSPANVATLAEASAVESCRGRSFKRCWTIETTCRQQP